VKILNAHTRRNCCYYDLFIPLIPLYTSGDAFDFDMDMMWTWTECGFEFLIMMTVEWDKS
jgi:hypothetical protein